MEMGNEIDQEKLKLLAKELGKGIKTEKYLGVLSRQQLKLTVEMALGAEMEEHLGYAKHEAKGRKSGNSRNRGGFHSLDRDWTWRSVFHHDGCIPLERGHEEEVS